MIELLLLPISLIVSIVSSMVGLGGGVFYVPILTLVFGLPMRKAIGLSVLTMTFTTITATIVYVKQKRINYKIGLLLDALDIPGAMIGAYLTSILKSKILAVLFGIMLLVIAVKMLEKRSNSAGISEKTYEMSTKVIFITLTASFLSGLVAGLLGAGGGTIDESTMILALNMPVLIASATSIFAMTITNTVATTTHIILGNIIVKYAIPLVIGSIIGARIGPNISKMCGEENLRKILGVVFIVIAIRMIITPLIP
ncbi:MAG: sulfite exporter TauE/SafE family protein [Candidatus Baldrarchaeia archaeon]